ncbi:NAD(P)/FAD-dependent oxidoreductase [Natrinema salsiterrestre]|uniref:NAD(P)/FAD-dependent oxidoreductase n=1 Tax=Natrinema salsiterrestre TaxID=2950540 RepID=A0A9Q4L7P1_9EURY|nr:NAD(P)/FAD-dependent oxidoreductase [Natrinema salsiterrestre]MDF9746756.1 NAD(P)/FAD-dependent oxidoreductase [Natrinema salsiterrestre]
MIGIVGGGIAGLSAAYRLQQNGYDVRVFEASDDIGGLAATYETSGDSIEKFYHHLSQSEETIIELAEELGLGDAVEWRHKSDAFYVDGDVYPMDTIWEIATFPHLSLYDKFRLGMLTMEVDVRGGLPSFDTYDDFTDFEYVPVTDFLLQHTTENVYETFWEPLLDAKFGSRKDDVSAAWLLGRIKFRGERDILRGEQLGYFEGSFARLLEALVEAVGRENIVTGARVSDVQYARGAVESLTVRRSDETETHDVETVVVATMPNVLESLTNYECEIDFQGTVCAVVSIPEQLTDTYWLNIVDDARFGVLIEHTNFVPTDRYGGEHLLYLASYVQDPTEPLWQMSDDEVRSYWFEGIRDLFPSFDPDAVNWISVARNPRTAPIYEQGYLDMVVPYDLSDEVADGVYYAGMASRAQYPERSLNGGIEAGYTCAEKIDENEVAARREATIPRET